MLKAIIYVEAVESVVEAVDCCRLLDALVLLKLLNLLLMKLLIVVGYCVLLNESVVLIVVGYIMCSREL